MKMRAGGGGGRQRGPKPPVLPRRLQHRIQTNTVPIRIAFSIICMFKGASPGRASAPMPPTTPPTMAPVGVDAELC